MQRPGFLHQRNHKAQGILEFALALPILLMLVFGIIEFGRLMQSWLALENGARFGVRYAITGNYDRDYCDEAAEVIAPAFGMSTEELVTQDQLDGNLDCRVPFNASPHIEDWEDKSTALQDWARLPSIRDTVMAGATGIGWREESTGDYIEFLSNPSATFDAANRGDPSAPGYLDVMICSSRGDEDTYFRLDDDPHYLGGVPDEAHRFPIVCQQANSSSHAGIAYIDDSGGPGDRVRITLTYRHPMITPFLSSWWPTLRLSSQREGLVEKFRTSRVTGLTGGMAFAPSDTHTATPTHTPTNTPTAFVCDGAQGVLWERWDNITPVPDANSVQSLLNDYRYPWFSDGYGIQPGFSATQSAGQSNFGARWRGLVCPPYSAYYKFWVASDDNSVLKFNALGLEPTAAVQIAQVTGWENFEDFKTSNNSGDFYLVAGRQYYIELLFKEGDGGDHASVAWTWDGVGIPDQTVPTVIPRENLYPVVRETVPAEILCEDNTGPLREYWIGLNVLPTPITNINTFATKISGRPPQVAPQGNSFPGIFMGPVNWRDNYGQRFRAYLCPPRTGYYTFWIASDDDSYLYLSPSESESQKTRIALVSGSVSAQNWFSKTGQQSVNVLLQGGQRYFIETIHREGSGQDHMAVAWTGPFMNKTPQVIEGKYLVPFLQEYAVTGTAGPAATATPRPAACTMLQARVDSLGTPAPDRIYLQDNYIDLYLKNIDPSYTIELSGMTGSYIDPWHRVDATRPAISLSNYRWTQSNPPASAAVLASPNMALGEPVQNWNNNPFTTTGYVEPLAEGNMRLNWSTNFATSNGFTAFDAYIKDYFSGYQKNSNYYHGDDFTLKLYYKVGNLTCTLDATGVRGPVITATRLDGTSGRFNLRANVTTSTAWSRSVREVHFTVYRNGVVMHHEVDTSAPYCLFGRDAASCPTNLAGYVWNKGTLRTDDDVRIDPGNYVIYIVGADTGFSLTNNTSNFTGSYATRVRYDLNLVSSLPTPVTPTIAPPTQTRTATATTRVPTSTIVVPTATTRVPTSTTAAPITQTPSNTPNYTRTPTATLTPTPTRTPRPTQCSPEDPGCIPPTPTP